MAKIARDRGNDASVFARALDALVYATVITAVLACATLVFAVPFGGEANWVKQLLFVFGWLAFGYSLVHLWPNRTELDSGAEKRTAPEDVFDDLGNTIPFGLRMRSIPIISGALLPPQARWSDGVRVFVLSLVLLLVSFLIEAFIEGAV